METQPWRPVPGDLSPRGSPRWAGLPAPDGETALWGGPPAQSSDGRAGPAVLPPRCRTVSSTETYLEKRWAFTEPKASQADFFFCFQAWSPRGPPLPEDGNAERVEMVGQQDPCGGAEAASRPARVPGVCARAPRSLQEAPCGPGVSHVGGAEGVSGQSPPRTEVTVVPLPAILSTLRSAGHVRVCGGKKGGREDGRKEGREGRRRREKVEGGGGREEGGKEGGREEGGERRGRKGGERRGRRREWRRKEKREGGGGGGEEVGEGEGRRGRRDEEGQGRRRGKEREGRRGAGLLRGNHSIFHTGDLL